MPQTKLYGIKPKLIKNKKSSIILLIIIEMMYLREYCKYRIDIVLVNVKGVEYERILLNPFPYCYMASLDYWLEYMGSPPHAQTGEIKI